MSGTFARRRHPLGATASRGYAPPSRERQSLHGCCGPHDRGRSRGQGAIMAKCTKRRRFSLLRQLRRRQAARAAIGMESLEPRAMLTTLYWDPNGATPGLGGSGTWDLLSANWTTDPTGSSPTIAWTNNSGDVAVFNTSPDSSGNVPASTVTIGSGRTRRPTTRSASHHRLPIERKAEA